MIDFARAEKAAEFIRDHAEKYGDLVGLCKALEQKRKVVHGEQFLKAAGTVAEREATAYASLEYRQICEDIRNAWADKETIATKIEAARITTDLYRTSEASNRRIDRSHQ